jgi:hypothetical protein
MRQVQNWFTKRRRVFLLVLCVTFIALCSLMSIFLYMYGCAWAACGADWTTRANYGVMTYYALVGGLCGAPLALSIFLCIEVLLSGLKRLTNLPQFRMAVRR